MQPALIMTEDERLWFMQALNAVAWAVAWNNQPPRNDWQKLLQWLGELLNVSKAEYQFRDSVPGIAEKVNQISNPRARLYFLRIVHDIYRCEFDRLVGSSFSSMKNRTACTQSFLKVYKSLTETIQLD